ncbi:MAG: PLP-dependent aminotransferase family protein [Clostridia bacterium]|nr:PLP-dependent aminotransferase family protein [Clostridia bacterium]
MLSEYGQAILQKSDNKGCETFREEIRLFLARNKGITVTLPQIVVGSGAEYLYGLLGQLLRDRRFATEAPCYEKITQVYSAMGIAFDPLPLSPSGISGEALNGTDATVLHVTPFHSYPAGITVSASKKREYLAWAKERNGFIIEDNFDSELTVSGKPEESLYKLANGERVVYVNTFSKTVSSSLRVGYMLLPLELLDAFEEKLGFYSCTVPTFDQYILAELLRSGNFERHINRIRRLRRQNKSEL